MSSAPKRTVVNYTGPRLNGKVHGQGHVDYSDGSTFDGTFFNGKKYGRGCMTNASGLRAYRNYYDDQRTNGIGAATSLKSGEHVYGHFVNDRIVSGAYGKPDGTTFFGTFGGNGRPLDGALRRPNGDMIGHHYVNGQVDPFAQTHTNAPLHEALFRDDDLWKWHQVSAGSPWLLYSAPALLPVWFAM